MDSFHLIKTVLKCIGKYPVESGAVHICLESGMFGPTIIQNSVLNGGHYNRSLLGIIHLAEGMQRILYAVFFK